MKATISFKNKSKTVTVNNLKLIEYAKKTMWDDWDRATDIVKLDNNFNDFSLDNVKNEVKFIGDSTLSAISSSIESVLFESES
ncbi:hypothetical protein HUK49_03490 [Limosilactobacillus sp. c11Ua_112_M]|uniref:hypothetical protein n=1 Tax=Limosilactobacillus portuensis TaxID=2742601 RepID=UPI00177AAD53|nr:hypothetical protein [Limosilactobacillus portuensis]MBD8087029.1 hypothetical protein [Limosilactobacillus portuensis]